VKTLTLIFISVLISLKIVAQTCPSSIRVGSSCGTGTSCSPCSTANCCHNCTGTVDVVAFETYVKRVLPQEWLNCWGSQTGGMNSLRAGAVAIRSYTIPRIANLVSCHGTNYDICRTTCCHVYSTSQHTNSNNAADTTANIVLVSGSTIQLSEYAAEQNNHPSCGNGFKGNGTGTWPCTTDGPCTGQTYNGHGRGMCQNGSARWATGLNLVNSSCTWQSPHGYGTKTWQQILSHYYPNWTLTTCGSSATPLCNNDNSCSPTTLSINTSGNCVISSCGTVNATSDASITYYGASTCASLYQSGRYDDDVWFSITPSTSNPITIRATPTSNTSNFNVAIGLYQGSCTNPTQVGCADSYGVGVTENLNYTPTASTTYLIRVFSYGIGSTYSGNFNICVFSSCSTPTQPETILGDTTVCQSSSQTYSISSVSGATSYTWTLPSGWIGTSATTSITATAGSLGGTISVTANNSCGSSTPRTLSVSVTPTPTQPETILGDTTVCQSSSQTYSISSVSGATSYTWTLPSGWTGSSATTSITATAGSSGGIISVTANNSCESSTPRTLSVSVTPTPTQPETISGDTTVCQSSSQTYSISSVSGATSYTWTLPSGWTGSSGTTSITATAGSSGGTISVTANNSCGSSTPRTLSVSVSPTPTQPETISGDTTVCQSSSQTYSISSVSGATSYTWTLPSGWIGSSATTSITAAAESSGGTISVTANNSCGSSTPQTLSVTIFSVDTSITVNGFIFTSNATSATYQWVTCPAMQIINGETNQIYSPSQNGIYAVIVTQNSCTDTSSCYQVTTTGLSFVNNSTSIIVYPNPTNSLLNVKGIGLTDDIYKMTLTNSLGQLLNEKEFSVMSKSMETQFDIQEYSSGMYFMTISSKTINHVFKIQKQ